MNTKQCEYCNNQFEAERISSKYCCDSCKTKAYLRRKKVNQQPLSPDNLTINQQNEIDPIVSESASEILITKNEFQELEENLNQQQSDQTPGAEHKTKRRKNEKRNPLSDLKPIVVLSAMGICALTIGAIIHNVITKDDDDRTKRTNMH